MQWRLPPFFRLATVDFCAVPARLSALGRPRKRDFILPAIEADIAVHAEVSKLSDAVLDQLAALVEKRPDLFIVTDDVYGTFADNFISGRIKNLTGGDAVKARFMRQDEFVFTPQFKLVISGNHRPALRNVDVAMRRRLHLLPFTVTIEDREKDPDPRRQVEG